MVRQAKPACQEIGRNWIRMRRHRGDHRSPRRTRHELCFPHEAGDALLGDGQTLGLQDPRCAIASTTLGVRRTHMQPQPCIGHRMRRQRTFGARDGGIVAARADLQRVAHHAHRILVPVLENRRYFSLIATVSRSRRPHFLGTRSLAATDGFPAANDGRPLAHWASAHGPETRRSV